MSRVVNRKNNNLEKNICIQTHIRIYLQKIYNFDEWHITPPIYKKYIEYIRNFVGEEKSLCQGKIVEVGCGLGDIIGDLNVKCNTVGYDISIEVLRAARLLHPKTKFQYGSIGDVNEGKIDWLVLINWVQDIDDISLKEMIEICKNKNEVNGFIVDKFVRVSKSYTYLHDWQKILGSEYRLKRRSRGFDSAEDNRRYIEVWEKNK